MTKTAFSFLAIIIVVTLACLPLILYGPQTGHSLYVNLPWSHYFAQEVIQGVFYPRWLMGMNQGAGSPVFFFYAPVPFYFSTLSAALFANQSETVQLGIGQYLIVLASALGFFLFLRRYAHQAIAVFAAIAYALAPYHFGMDLLTRQAMGEAAAFIWIPLVFLAVDRLSVPGKGLILLALSYALLVMTHLPSALLCSPFFLLYCLLRCGFATNWIILVRFALGILVGLLVAGCYLVPALGTQDYTYTDHLWEPYFDMHRWFFFDGLPSPNPEVETQVFAVASVGSLFFILSWSMAFLYSERAQKPLLFGLLIIFTGAWFLMTPLSLWLWQLLPFLQKVQFPWRVMVIQEFAVVTSLGLALSVALRSGRRWALATAAALAVAFSAWVATIAFQDYQPHIELMGDEANVRSLRGQAVGGNDAKEYLPLTVKADRRKFLEQMSTLEPMVFDQGRGHIDIVRWQNRAITLDIRMRSATPVAVKQLLYPGWEVTLNGEPLAIEPTARYGLIRFQAPAGVYRVEMKLRTLPEERIGWVVSGVGLTLLLLLPFGRILQNKGRREANIAQTIV
ncbi:MAG: 6-pyruvoyl-tetrahydropterin synthase-related protein [Halioglobus sp.]